MLMMTKQNPLVQLRLICLLFLFLKSDHSLTADHHPCLDVHLHRRIPNWLWSYRLAAHLRSLSTRGQRTSRCCCCPNEFLLECDNILPLPNCHLCDRFIPFVSRLTPLGASKTFGIFAVIDALALYFVFKFVPETKGLSLEDIEILLGSRVSPALRTLSKAGEEGTNGSSVTSPLLRGGERYDYES